MQSYNYIKSLLGLVLLEFGKSILFLMYCSALSLSVCVRAHSCCVTPTPSFGPVSSLP
jgi:hypothetical protein